MKPTLLAALVFSSTLMSASAPFAKADHLAAIPATQDIWESGLNIFLKLPNDLGNSRLSSDQQCYERFFFTGGRNVTTTLQGAEAPAEGIHRFCKLEICGQFYIPGQNTYAAFSNTIDVTSHSYVRQISLRFADPSLQVPGEIELSCEVVVRSESEPIAFELLTNIMGDKAEFHQLVPERSDRRPRGRRHR